MHHPRWLVPALIALLLGTIATASGQIGPAEPGPPAQPDAGGEQILFIGSINADCFADTVLGSRVGEAPGYLPRRILWGIPHNTGDGGGSDPACSGGTPSGRKVRQTVLSYASEQIQGGSVAFQHRTADSLADIVIHMRWKAGRQGVAGQPEGGEGGGFRSVVVVGQYGLDSIPVIDIGTIRGFQAWPFCAMELLVGSELTHPATRPIHDDVAEAREEIPFPVGEGEVVRAEHADRHPGIAPVVPACPRHRPDGRIVEETTPYYSSHIYWSGVAGARYFFSPSLALHGRLGWGVSVLSAGLNLTL